MKSYRHTQFLRMFRKDKLPKRKILSGHLELKTKRKYAQRYMVVVVVSFSYQGVYESRILFREEFAGHKVYSGVRLPPESNGHVQNFMFEFICSRFGTVEL